MDLLPRRNPSADAARYMQISMIRCSWTGFISHTKKHGVTVFKTDASVPELMPEEDWYKVNIITCAAPNLRKEPSRYEKFHFCRGAADVTAEQLAILHKSRIRRIFEIAAYGRNEVLILGAFGCGAFRNPPEIVAGVFREVQEEYKNAFETIEYAIYHTDKDVFNYKIFQKKLLH